MPETDASLHPRLYRAIRKHRWYDKENRQVLPIAFELRESDEGKLSVLKSVNCSPGGRENCYAGLGTCYGEFVLPTEGVRSLDLAVHDDDLDDPRYSENHANIVGVPEPPYTDDTLKQAEDLQAQLAELSSLHYDREHRYS